MSKKTKEKTTDLPFKCDFPGCSRSFSKKRGLTMHKLKTHGIIKPRPRSAYNRDPAEYPLKCLRCDFRTKSKAALSIHIRKVHGIKTSLEVKRQRVREAQKKSYLKRRTEKPEEYPFECTVQGCGFRAKTKSGLGIHLSRIHNIIKLRRDPFETRYPKKRKEPLSPYDEETMKFIEQRTNENILLTFYRISDMPNRVIKELCKAGMIKKRMPLGRYRKGFRRWVFSEEGKELRKQLGIKSTRPEDLPSPLKTVIVDSP